MSSYAPDQVTEQTPIIVTGGDNGIGEVLRGEVLHIDYDEASANEAYCREMLDVARRASAPEAVISSLEEIMDRFFAA